MFLDTSLVTIDDAEFDQWVGNHLDTFFGPRPAVSAVPPAGLAGNQQAMDYLALSKMLATTIGSSIMQFSQAITPVAGAVGATGGETALAIGKEGCDQDQIGKLKDVCGVLSAQQIPPLWSVIHTPKGKRFDTYRAYIVKAINIWCRSHHINRSKCIFLLAKFFEDLVSLCFNPGGPVAQLQSVAQGISILACQC